MILVDIGNTTIHFGIDRENKIIKDFRIYNKEFNIKYLKKILNKYPRDEIIICSVAPTYTKIFKLTKRKIYIIGKDIKVPIKCFYNYNQIGQDRLVNSLAAKILYPETHIIIDFGTAITIDFLSKRGDYLGGFILPGINLYLQSLSQCQLLPSKIKLIKTKSIIPKNTTSSISKGLVEGFSLMINAFIKKYKNLVFKKYNMKPKIIITGGESTLLKKRLDFDYIYEPLLTLKGLVLIKKILKD